MHALDALGNPVRRSILHELRAGPLSVGAIAAGLPLSRPAVSRHLRVLEEAGLVQAHEKGTQNIYSASLTPDIDHSIIDLGFQYQRNCDLDRQARGGLTNFTT